MIEGFIKELLGIPNSELNLQIENLEKFINLDTWWSSIQKERQKDFFFGSCNYRFS